MNRCAMQLLSIVIDNGFIKKSLPILNLIFNHKLNKPYNTLPVQAKIVLTHFSLDVPSTQRKQKTNATFCVLEHHHHCKHHLWETGDVCNVKVVERRFKMDNWVGPTCFWLGPIGQALQWVGLGRTFFEECESRSTHQPATIVG